MASMDVGTSSLGVNAFDNQSITSDTTTVGNIIDSQGAEGLEFYIQSGTLNDGNFLPLIEDGDAANLSDASPVSDTFLIGTEADATFTDSADNNKVKQIGYVGKKRFVRLSLVSTSTTGANFLSSTAVQMPLEQKNITA